MALLKINEDLCTLCGTCIETCPSHIIFNQDDSIQTRDEEHCIVCGHCVAVCPEGAMAHCEMNTEEFLPLDKSKQVSPETLTHFLRSRRSCRNYSQEPVPRALLEKLVDIGRFAPTAHNWQHVDVIVVEKPEMVKKLSTICSEFFGKNAQAMEASKEPIDEHTQDLLRGFKLIHQFHLEGKDRIFRGAPVVILLHGPEENNYARDNCLYTLFHMVMMAQSLGLGSCINGYFPGAAEWVPELPELLRVKKGNKIFGCLTIGYPEYSFEKLTSRKPASVSWM